ncbi:MAG: CDP-alcohol phosphatidyltransferase family protein [Myxococcales bacterium]|nr:CDP-alcohol phosphatidyltransferase family protein [Myxococcales bacterium]
MGRYRARDAVRLPSLISWSRVPLALLFPFAVHDPWLAATVLLAAALSDVVDGALARRLGLVTATGAVIDGLTDKLFVATVVVTLVVVGTLPASATLLLGAREIGEAPLVVWYAVSARLRRARVQAPAANVPGKVATVLQFAAVVFAIFGSPHTTALLWGTGAAGVIAAISYARRAVGLYRAFP